MLGSLVTFLLPFSSGDPALPPRFPPSLAPLPSAFVDGCLALITSFALYACLILSSAQERGGLLAATQLAEQGLGAPTLPQLGSPQALSVPPSNLGHGVWEDARPAETQNSAIGSECPLKYCFNNFAAMVFPDYCSN